MAYELGIEHGEFKLAGKQVTIDHHTVVSPAMLDSLAVYKKKRKSGHFKSQNDRILSAARWVSSLARLTCILVLSECVTANLYEPMKSF